MPLSVRLNALALTEVPAEVNVRMFPAEPEVDEPPSNARTANALRLSFVDESPIELDGLGRRAALAATDLLIGSLIAAIAYVGLNQGVWITVGLILSYFTLGRLISDEPLLYHVYRRLRTRPAAVPVVEDASDEVAPVADPASTVA